MDWNQTIKTTESHVKEGKKQGKFLAGPDGKPLIPKGSFTVRIIGQDAKLAESKAGNQYLKVHYVCEIIDVEVDLNKDAEENEKIKEKLMNKLFVAKEGYSDTEKSLDRLGVMVAKVLGANKSYNPLEVHEKFVGVAFKIKNSENKKGYMNTFFNAPIKKQSKKLKPDEVFEYEITEFKGGYEKKESPKQAEEEATGFDSGSEEDDDFTFGD